MPGARCTRGLVCQELCIWRTRAYRFSGNTPASPAQRLYGLFRALPGGALSYSHIFEPQSGAVFDAAEDFEA